MKSLSIYKFHKFSTLLKKLVVGVFVLSLILYVYMIARTTILVALSQNFNQLAKEQEHLAEANKAEYFTISNSFDADKALEEGFVKPSDLDYITIGDQKSLGLNSQ